MILRNHAQNLKEAQPSQSGSREHLSTAAQADNGYASRDDHYVCKGCRSSKCIPSDYAVINKMMY